jgi:6,7-dimethyl-8-ribityllumazine synthase
MSLDSPALEPVAGASFRIAIAAACFNARLVDALLAQVVRRLHAAGVPEAAVTVARVPGSNELPVAAQWLIDCGRPDAVVALGVIVRGDTIHYELIAQAATAALQQVALASGVPVINGIVVAENEAQAEARCLGAIDRGAEFAHAAVAMAALKRRLLP